jgi:hypothetical protein
VTCCYVVPVTSAVDAHYKLGKMRDYNETLSEGLLNNGYGFHQVNLALVRARGDGYPLDGAMFRWRDPCRPEDEPKSGWVDDLTHVLFSPEYETPALWFRWVMPSSIRDESEPPSPMMEVISDLGGVLASAVYAKVKFLGKTHKDLTGFKAGVTTDFIEEAVQLMQRTLASLCRLKSEVEAELLQAEELQQFEAWVQESVAERQKLEAKRQKLEAKLQQATAKRQQAEAKLKQCQAEADEAKAELAKAKAEAIEELAKAKAELAKAKAEGNEDLAKAKAVEDLEALLKEVEEEEAATKPAARGCKRKAPEACDDSE